MEIWKKIPGFERYEVSSMGRVKSTSFGKHSTVRVMKLKRHKQGYFEVGLYDRPKCEGGSQKTLLVHTLALEAFVGSPRRGEVCRHLDGNPSNNRIENLQWGTQSENWHDTRGHGTESRCKFTDEDVRRIRESFVRGRKGNAQKLANEFNVHPRTITECVAGRTYAWVT